MANCEVPHNQGWTKGTNCLGLGLKLLSVDKANEIADNLETSWHRMTCDENHERPVDARVQAPLEAAVNSPPKELDYVTYKD